jgi:ATP phosphoribosyltransferase
MRVGTPKGRFAGFSHRVLEHLEVDTHATGALRLLGLRDQAWLLKARDIPGMVAAGMLEIGLAPLEWVEELGTGCEVVGRVGGYDARISLLVPSSPPPPGRVLRVATEFPVLAARCFAEHDGPLEIIEVHGSTEALPPELADVVVDCVETGATAKSHGLAEQRVVLECAMVVVVAENAGDEVRRQAEELVEVLNQRRHDPAPDGRRLALHALPPILRAACLPAIRDDSPIDIEGVGSVRLARPRGALPSYLVLWDRTTELHLSEPAGDEDVRAALDASIRRGDLRVSASDLFSLTVLLSMWDDMVRAAGLVAGRVYLASEEAVSRLYGIAGLTAPADVDALLVEAQSLELIYRFPVAFKFRRAYGGENQCRLNGWGRRLARRMLEDGTSLAMAEDWGRRIEKHLREHAEDYRAHVDHVASRGLADAPADSWDRSAALPVPLLL